MVKKLDYNYCKAAPILDWLGNKWALVIILKVSEFEPMRFNELYRNIPAVSEKVLSQVLKRLLTDGILSREIFPDVPPRVEYSLTDLGHSLLPHIKSLLKWGQDNFSLIITNRQSNSISDNGSD